LIKNNNLSSYFKDDRQMTMLAKPLLIFAAIPIQTFADQLAFLTSDNHRKTVEIIDSMSDTVMMRIDLKDRKMPIDDAIKLQTAMVYSICCVDDADDLIALRQGGAKTASISVNPVAGVLDGGHFYGVVGDEQPGFAYEIDLSSGHTRFHDTFALHAYTIRAVRRRIFVSDYRAGVLWADPTSGPARLVDDRYDAKIRFRWFDGGVERPDAAGRADAKGLKSVIYDGGADMVVGRGGKTLYVLSVMDEHPVLLFIDTARAKIVEVLRLGTKGAAGIRHLEIGGDGTIYAGFQSGDKNTLSLYRLDGASSKAVGRTDIDLRALATAAELEDFTMTIGGDRLFLALGHHLVALAATDPSRVLAATDLPDFPGRIVATRDGRKVYANDLPVVLTNDDRLVIGAPLRLGGEPWLEGIDKSSISAPPAH
jgi:hypothetical protein